MDAKDARPQDARMEAQAQTSETHLLQAEALLRDVLEKEFEGSTDGDAASLERMRLHLVNMHRAVATSPEVHANVAKRLGDFAMTTTRLAARWPASSVRMTELANTLRAASSELHAASAATDPPGPELPRVG